MHKSTSQNPPADSAGSADSPDSPEIIQTGTHAGGKDDGSLHELPQIKSNWNKSLGNLIFDFVGTKTHEHDGRRLMSLGWNTNR